MARRLLHLTAAAALVLSPGCNVGTEFYEYRASASTSAPLNLAPELTLVFVAPLEASIGSQIALSAEARSAAGDLLTYHWSGQGGVIAAPSATDTTFTCKTEGSHALSIRVTSSHGSVAMSADVFCRGG